jgi:hypothetical protein
MCNLLFLKYHYNISAANLYLISNETEAGDRNENLKEWERKQYDINLLTFRSKVLLQSSGSKNEPSEQQAR